MGFNTLILHLSVRFWSEILDEMALNEAPKFLPISRRLTNVNCLGGLAERSLSISCSLENVTSIPILLSKDNDASVPDTLKVLRVSLLIGQLQN